MSKELTPAEYIDVVELQSRMKAVAKGDRLNPYEHDGSYEICQKAAELYYRNMPDSPMYSDLDLFYKLAGILHYKTKEEKIKACTLDDTSKQDLIKMLKSIEERASKNAYNNAVDGSAVATGKFGLFNTPIGTFGCKGKKQGVPDEAIPSIIGLFSKVWKLSKTNEPAEKMYAEVDCVFNTWIRGIQAAALSQILHCIAPEAFPVLNGQQGRDCVFVCLGVKGLCDIGKATTYAANCRKIAQFRDVNYPEVRNFREFDLLGFHLPRVHVKKAEIDPLESISMYAKAGATLDFRKDEACLNGIKKREAEVNVFEVLGITSTEIRHSRMLAWFLRQDETHGLGDAVLRNFLGAVYDNEGQPETLGRILKGSLSSFIVKREKDDIDLRVVSNREKVVVLIENKVFSGEHDDQLGRYQEYAEEEYKDYSRYYVYLTPRGAKSSKPDLWHSISYKQVMDWVESSVKEAEGDITSESKSLIDQYLDTIRRNVLDEDEIVEICREIYDKHRTAIDLIIKHHQQIVDRLEISEEARRYSEILQPGIADVGFEGVFVLSTGQFVDIDRDGIFGIPDGANARAISLGADSSISVDKLSRTLTALWSEITNAVECQDYDPAIQLSRSQTEDEPATICIRVINLATDWDSAVELALQRGLTSIIDLSNDSLVDVHA